MKGLIGSGLQWVVIGLVGGVDLKTKKILGEIMAENQSDFARTSGNLIRSGEITLDLENFARKYL